MGEAAGLESERGFAGAGGVEAQAGNVQLQGDDLGSHPAQGLEELLQIRPGARCVIGFGQRLRIEAEVGVDACHRQAVELAAQQAQPSVVGGRPRDR